MRAVLKLMPQISSRFKVNVLRNFATALNEEQVTTTVNHETLKDRLLLYLSVDKEIGPAPSTSPTEIAKRVRRNPNHIHKLSLKEIINVSSVLSNRNITKQLNLLNYLDTECYSRLSILSTSDIFKLLNTYMRIIPGRITDLKFYRHSVKVLYNSVHSLSKKDLLQLIFYIGLPKKNLESQTMLRHCLRIMDNNLINNLTSEELCIICNSTFKTSTKITNMHLLGKVRDYISNNLSVLKDSPVFVTLVKTLRHNRYQNDDLLNTISCALLFNKTFTLYSFSMICHILALFADYFFYDERIFKLLTKICLKQLSESKFISREVHPEEQVRAKDIKRFLWVMGMFSEMKLINHSDIENVIIPQLLERIEIGEFERDHNSLLDISLYLWMLNYHPNELVPYVFSEKTELSRGKASKSNLRLNLLLQAIYFENPDLAEKLSLKPVSIPSNVISSYQLQKRPLVTRLLNNLEKIKPELNITKFELSQEIPHLNVVGITGFKDQSKKAVYVEVLDDYNRLKNMEEDVPVGLMALKLRLLDRTEEGVLVVSQREVEEMIDADLKKYLLEELKLIC